MVLLWPVPLAEIFRTHARSMCQNYPIFRMLQAFQVRWKKDGGSLAKSLRYPPQSDMDPPLAFLFKQ